MPPWTAAKVAVKGIWVALVGAVVAASLIFGAVQTVRLEGFKIWPFEITGWKQRALDAENSLEQLPAAMERNRAAQQAVIDAEAERTRDISERGDNEQARDQAIARSDTDRFVADNRVRACPAGGDGGRTDPGAADLDPRVPEALPTGVVVGEADVRACADLYVYAVSAHNYAMRLANPE